MALCSNIRISSLIDKVTNIPQNGLTVVYKNKENCSDIILEKYSYIGGKLIKMRIDENGRSISGNGDVDRQYTAINCYLSMGGTQIYNNICLFALINSDKSRQIFMVSRGHILLKLDYTNKFNLRELRYLNYMWIIDSANNHPYTSVNTFSKYISHHAWINTEYASVLPKELRMIVVEMI